MDRETGRLADTDGAAETSPGIPDGPGSDHVAVAVPCRAAAGRPAGGSPVSCTVVVCTRDRPRELDRCLEAVRRSTYPDVGVLVVDNAPTRAAGPAVAARWGARYTLEPVTGLSRARNRGARACSTDIVAFVDDDALPEPGWIAGLVRQFADPLVMAVTGRILPLARRDNAYPRAQTSDADPGRGIKVVDRHTPTWFELSNFGGLGDGGNMAFRRRAFEVWPGFDERLGRGTALHGGEEHLAFFSLIDRGYRVVYTPEAVVRHPFPEAPEERRACYLRDVAAATAYITLLLVEAPQYRRLTLRYVLEWLRGTRRPWRGEAPERQGRVAPRWRALMAYASGPLIYARSRRRPGCCTRIGR